MSANCDLDVSAAGSGTAVDRSEGCDARHSVRTGESKRHRLGTAPENREIDHDTRRDVPARLGHGCGIDADAVGEVPTMHDDLDQARLQVLAECHGDSGQNGNVPIEVHGHRFQATEDRTQALDHFLLTQLRNRLAPLANCGMKFAVHRVVIAQHRGAIAGSVHHCGIVGRRASLEVAVDRHQGPSQVCSQAAHGIAVQDRGRRPPLTHHRECDQLQSGRSSFEVQRPEVFHILSIASRWPVTLRTGSRSIVTNYALPVTVDDYLDAAPEPQRSTLRQLRAMLATILPDAEEAISYGVPAFRLGSKAIAGYAHAKRHCSYFPHSGSVIDQVEPELLEGYDWGKGTLRFPVDRVPSEALVRRLVEIRFEMLAMDCRPDRTPAGQGRSAR